MCEKYTVDEIYEMDFGCEGRPADMEDMVQVRLLAADGKSRILRESDARLYEQKITEGMEVYLDEGRLKRWKG